jgi:hypothetical protein
MCDDFHRKILEGYGEMVRQRKESADMKAKPVSLQSTWQH